MKVTIEDDNGIVLVFEGIVYNYKVEVDFEFVDDLQGPRQPKRTGSGDLEIEMRYHNGPRGLFDKL